jgi:glycosyltransferase involved in cell wall biosynthesis
VKVIHITPDILNESSGTSYAVRRIHEECLGLSIESSIACITHEKIIFTCRFGATYFPTFNLNLSFLKRLGISSKLKNWIYIEGRNTILKPILHNHGMWQFNSLYPGWCAKKLGNILVVSPHGMLSEWAMSHGSYFKPLFWRLFQHRSLNCSSMFHATSMIEYQDIRKLGFIQPIAIIPLGIDICPHPKERLITKRKSLLFLGRLHPKKGLNNLLEAWKIISSEFPDWDLNIVGDDDVYNGSTGYCSELKKMVLQNNIFLSLKNLPVYNLFSNY